MTDVGAAALQSAYFTANAQAKNTGLSGQYKDVSIQNKASTLDAATLAKIDESAKQYESVFLSEMLSHMFEGITMGGGMDGEEKAANSIYKSLMVKEYADGLAEKGGIGLAKDIRANLIELQSAQFAAQEEEQISE
jgi:Rod binding domain-containing protein